jgi:membrane-bound lytic murein transglycosylase B
MVLAGLACGLSSGALALDAQRNDVRAFIGQMQDRHGFDPAVLNEIFGSVESKESIIAAMTRPAEKRLTWPEYRKIFITEKRVSGGARVAREQSAALTRAAARGVPASVIVAITGVETFYGGNIGSYRVVDALSTLAFDYPPRSEFFRRELEQFLLMSREESVSPLGPVGSYAGAMGIPQFMPSSFREYAVDGNGDGRRDLWGSWDDVFASVANYLKVHGWQDGEPVMVAANVANASLQGLDTGSLEFKETVASLKRRGIRFDTDMPAATPAMLIELPGESAPSYRVGFRNFYVITRYNRSRLYASAVNDLAEAIDERLPSASSPAGPSAEGPPAFSSGSQ